MSKPNFNERFFNIAKKLNLTKEQANELVYLFNPKTWENEENDSDNNETINNNINTIDYFPIEGNSTAINLSDFSQEDLKNFAEFLNNHSYTDNYNNVFIKPVALFNTRGNNVYFLNSRGVSNVLELTFIANLVSVNMDEITSHYTKVVRVSCTLENNKIVGFKNIRHIQKSW